METPLSTRRITRSLAAAAAAASARESSSSSPSHLASLFLDRRFDSSVSTCFLDVFPDDAHLRFFFSAEKSAAAAAGSDSAALFSRAKKAAAVETQAQTRAALHDISNDSPIVGLAAGGLHATDTTPASTAAKTRRRAPRSTPGSGEALLRGQVKALLHKVDEDQGCAAAAALVRPARIQALLGVSRSPAQLLAPTPANTPQIGPVSAPREGLLQLDGAAAVTCVLDEEELLIPKLKVM
jgi:hypothetical protein